MVECWALVRRNVKYGGDVTDIGSISILERTCREKGRDCDKKDPVFASQNPVVGIRRLEIVKGPVKYDAEGGGK